MAQILAMLQMIIIPKYLPMYLTDHLTHSEFRCSCNYDSCHYTLISQKLIDAYKELRTEWGGPIVINSGFRCQRHHEAIRKKNPNAVLISSHTTGLAIDIRPKISNDLNEFYMLAVRLESFDVVIKYKNFLHCHMKGE